MSSGYNNNSNFSNEDYNNERSTTMNPESFVYDDGHNAPYSNRDPYDPRYQINDDDDNDDGRYKYHHDNEEEDYGHQPYEENRYTNDDNDPYTASSSSSQHPHHNNYDNNNYDNYDDDGFDPHQPPPAPSSSSLDEQAPPPRKHKYSTANLREQGKWKKWCKILLLFLIMIAIMIGISMLMNHFFFGDTSDNGPPEMALRDENGTFAKDKQEIDSACGRNTLAMDEGTLCKEACVPEYFHCCDPFDEFVLYNYTVPTSNTTNATNTTDDGILSSKNRPENRPQEKNLTFLEGYEKDETCTFDGNVRGCMAYAKCHALAGQIDPAPANLPEMCSIENVQKDAVACTDLCRKVECCFSAESDNCLAEKFDLCMDYAPCQNLRVLTSDPSGVLEIAPRTLDYDCYFQQPSCTETCDKARCCSDVGDYSCFQYNFLSCITYSPCNNVTVVNITIAPQFNHVPQPSIDLVNACDTSAPIIEPSDRSCEDICHDAACCWSSTPGDNCFHQDPLGCLAYEAQCQALIS
jgi:hypothetical protein